MINENNGRNEINTSFKINNGVSSEIISGPMIGHVSMRSIDVWAHALVENTGE